MTSVNYGEAKKKLDAAMALLSPSSSAVSKLRSVGSLIRGLNPRMDVALTEYEKNLGNLEKILEGDMVTLSAEQLPETTEEEKNRKKFFLIFIKSWNDLKSEIVRVAGEMKKESSGTQSSGGIPWGKIWSGAKGPLGFLTVIAVGIAILDTSSVAVSIVNDGCGPIDAKTSVPISIPGLKLPNETIPTGGRATAVLPPMSFEVDGTTPGTLVFSSLKFTLSVGLSAAMDDVTFDGTSLLDTQSTIELGSAKTHELRVVCSS